MISALITLVIYLIVIGLLLWLANYVIDAIPLPEPFHRLAKILIVVIGVIIVILLLLQLIGVGGVSLPRING